MSSRAHDIREYCNGCDGPRARPGETSATGVVLVNAVKDSPGLSRTRGRSEAIEKLAPWGRSCGDGGRDRNRLRIYRDVWR